MEELKRKRPDRALALKRRKILQEHVIKATLSGVLKDQKVKDEIDSLVIYLSQLQNKATIFINRLLLHCVAENIDLPDLKDQNFYRQCLLVGMEGSTCKFPPLLTQVWNDNFHDFPNPTFKKYCTYAVNYVALKMKTSLINSLWVPFFKRQGYS